eukprot:6492460-Amphidinium_carterae.3
MSRTDNGRTASNESKQASKHPCACRTRVQVRAGVLLSVPDVHYRHIANCSSKNRSIIHTHTGENGQGTDKEHTDKDVTSHANGTGGLQAHDVSERYGIACEHRSEPPTQGKPS